MSVRHTLKPGAAGVLPSATLAMNELSNRMVSRGETVYKLGFGQSPFPVPRALVQELQKNAHKKEYVEVLGLEALRASIASYLRRWQGLAIETGNILIGPGSKELMYALQVCWGGSVILPAPSWVSYAPQARLAGNAVHFVETSASRGWKLLPDALARACDGLQGPQLLVLNYPNNPAGTTYREDELQALAEVVQAHDVLVMSDEIYGQLDHDGAHRSFARYAPEHTVMTSGLSKWCGAGGWRLGYMAFPESLDWLLDAMCRVASESWSCASAPIQHAAVLAFGERDDVTRYRQSCRNVVRAVGAYCATALGEDCPAPEGGFYLFPDFERHRGVLASRGIGSGEQLARRLLEETGVATLPGKVFGCADEALSLRLAYVDFDGAQALEVEGREPNGAELGDEQLARLYAPRVVEAVERMRRWLE